MDLPNSGPRPCHQPTTAHATEPRDSRRRTGPMTSESGLAVEDGRATGAVSPCSAELVVLQEYDAGEASNAAPLGVDHGWASAQLSSRGPRCTSVGCMSLARVCLIATVAVALGLVSTASAAFPGRNGMLAVRPLRGNGIVLVDRSGRGERRICTRVSVCGDPGRPQFSPDGRSIVFAGPAVTLVGTDGICQNCRFGVASAPAFRGDGTLVTFASGARVFEDGIDGIRQATVLKGSSLGSRSVSDAVWSVRGALAVAAGGRMWIGQPDRLRSIGRGSSPSWSGDGSRVAFVRRGWITVRRVSGGAARHVVRGMAPAFSPDGRWIAFVDRRHRIDVISSAGGKARPVGRVRGLAVDWQPLPDHPASCVPPPGAKVIARSSDAVVTAETGPPTRGGYGLRSTAVMGCLTANGRERLLESSTSNNVDSVTDYPMAALGGTYAGVVARNIRRALSRRVKHRRRVRLGHGSTIRLRRPIGSL